jgi:hypothetical protein
MKAWLVLQEGPGAGYAYPLDPFKQAVVTVGRSSECDVALGDQRASRHHGDIRWNGRHWEIVDRGSTNGTYVNGMQVHQAYDLRLGDRITIGETTLVLREFTGQAATPARQAGPARRRGPTEEGRAIGQAGAGGKSTGSKAYLTGPGDEGQRLQQAGAGAVPDEGGGGWLGVTRWLTQGVAAVAVVCLASGAFLPWLKITGSLSQDLEPLIQGLANVIATLSGPNSMFNVTQEIGGLEGYGKLTLAIAVVSLVALVVDVFLARRSMVAGVVYLVSGLVAGGAIGFDLINYYRFYNQIQSLTLLLGVRLTDVIELFDRFIELKVTPMVGLLLTAIGLVLLLVAGAGRLVVGLVGGRQDA